MKSGYIVTVLLLVIPSVVLSNLVCPFYCVCDDEGSVVCEGVPEGAILSTLDQLVGRSPFHSFAIRHSHISEVKTGWLDPFTQLTSLDLSGNSILHVGVNAFSELGKLQHLDLSANNLQSLAAYTKDPYEESKSIFTGLTRLKNLLLGENPLWKLSESSLEHLKALDFLDLSETMITCDCELKWLAKYRRRNGVRLSNGSRCYFPRRLRGYSLSDIRRRKWMRICRLPRAKVLTSSPLLSEGHSIAVVVGGDIALSCTTTSATIGDNSSSIEWFHEGKPIADDASQSDIRSQMHMQNLTSTLTIHKFSVAHRGRYLCRAEDGSMWNLKSFTLVPLHQHCVRETITNDKGVFRWRNTAGGSMATLVCPFAVVDGGQSKMIHRFCNSDGQWQNEEGLYANCDFASSTARGFALAETTKNWTLFYKASLGFDHGTEDGRLVFSRFLRTLHSLHSYGNWQELATVSNVLYCDPEEELHSTFWDTFVWLIRFRPLNQSLSFHNLAVCQQPLQPQTGFAATKLASALSCQTSKGVNSLLFGDHTAVFVPSLVFDLLDVSFGLAQFVWVKSSCLFAIGDLSVVDEMANRTTEWISEGDVIGLKLITPRNRFDFTSLLLTNVDERQTRHSGNETDLSLTSNDTLIVDVSPKRSPIVVVVRVSVLLRTSLISLAHWTGRSDKKWALNERENCVAMSTKSRFIEFHCQASWLAAVWNETDEDGYVFLAAFQEKTELDRTRRSRHPLVVDPWVYASAGFFICCMLISLFCQCCCCRTTVQLSRKLRHCLMNSWLSALFLCALFTIGVNKTTDPNVCLGISIGSHYLTLVVFTWNVLVLRTIQRKLYKASHRLLRVEDVEPLTADGAAAAHRGDLLGMYLLAWALPIIICSFVVAVRLPSYTAAGNFCYLYPDGDALTELGFWLPIGILLLVTLVIVLVIICCSFPSARRTTTKCNSGHLIPHSANETEAAVQDRRTLIDRQIVTDLDCDSVRRSVGELTDFSSIIDQRGTKSPSHFGHSLLSLIMLLLCLISGALYILKGRLVLYINQHFTEDGLFTHHEMIISYALSAFYCSSLVLFGLTTVFRYVTARLPMTQMKSRNQLSPVQNGSTNGSTVRIRNRGAREQLPSIEGMSVSQEQQLLLFQQDGHHQPKHRRQHRAHSSSSHPSRANRRSTTNTLPSDQEQCGIRQSATSHDVNHYANVIVTPTNDQIVLHRNSITVMAHQGLLCSPLGTEMLQENHAVNGTNGYQTPPYIVQTETYF